MASKSQPPPSPSPTPQHQDDNDPPGEPSELRHGGPGKALRESERRFRAIVEAAPVALLVNTLPDGVCLYGNVRLSECRRELHSQVQS